MTLSELCVRRPVFAAMLVTACVAIGALSFQKLGVDQYPDVEVPVVTVTTTLRGASPEEIETQVTKVIEDAVSTAEGIDELTSTSVEGVSSVTVNFVLDRSRDQATQDVRDRVARAVGRLPVGTDPPIVTRFDTTATPVITLVVSSEGRPLRELTELAQHQVLEPLQGVSGVGEVQVSGGRTRAFQIALDADRLAAQGLSIAAVRTAIEQQNVEVPGGRVESTEHEETLRTVARVADAEELRQLVVAERQGAAVRLGDLGTVVDSEADPRTLSRLDGRPAVALIIQKQSGSNTVQVVDAVLARIEALKSELPGDVRLEVVRDQSKFIRRSIHEVELHLVLGGFLASLAVLLFLGSFRSTLIAALAIPSSIIATFGILRVLGYTLNNFTLLALTLSVGIVIDDAIVVLENIYRHVENGEKPFDAAIRGVKEITLAVMATTLSLIVIFLPTAFMEGRVGRFWRSFGITTAFAIAVSLFVSLTLTPMLCSLLLKPPKHRDRKGPIDRFNAWLDRTYGRLVGWSLRWRWLVVVIALLTIGSVVPISQNVGQDFIPRDDTSDFGVSFVMPEGADLATASALTTEVERALRTVHDVRSIYTRIGAGRGDDVTNVDLYVTVTDLSERTVTLDAILTQVRRALASYVDLRPNVYTFSGMGGGGRSTQFSFSVRGPDLEVLTAFSDRLMTRMRATPGFVDVDSSAAVRKPEVRVIVDRRRAADLGVRAGEVATALRTMVGGEPVSKIREGAEQYDVWLRLEAADRGSVAALRALPIATRNGGLVRLDALSTIRRDRSPAQIERLDRVRQVGIGSNLDGLPLGAAVEQVRGMVRELDLPEGYTVVYGGRAKLMAQTFGAFLAALGLSFLFMYMILAAQFESLLHPVTIMLSLPLSLPFALLSLILMGDTINIYSAFGIFMLFGIIKKNGILQVDYTNTLRHGGMPRDEAIVKANETRLRPILMTTLTLIAGMIPIALGKGPGAASRASMANVIIGGQAMSLLITLLIVPVAYSLFDDAGTLFSRLRARFQKKTPPTEASVPESAE